MNQIILEVVQSMWTTQTSKAPFGRSTGFSWERRADGLHAWNVTVVELEGDNEYRKAAFHMPEGQLQAMLKFIADTHPVQSATEAMRVLIAHLRSPKGQPGCGRYLFFLLLPLLGMLCSLVVTICKSGPYSSFNPALSLLLGFLIATPLVMIAYLLIFSSARAQSRVVQQLTYQDPQQYLKALHAANRELQVIRTKPLRSISWLPIALWVVWLAAVITVTALL